MKGKVTHSKNILRLLQLSLLIFPYVVILLINIISENIKVFFTLGFVFFSIGYFFVIFFSCKLFLLDWDLFKYDDKIILKNILGVQHTINNDKLKKIKVKKILVSGILPYFKVMINNDEYLVRYFPKSNSYFNNYFKTKKLINKLKEELVGSGTD
jgi:hypothetical protein